MTMVDVERVLARWFAQPDKVLHFLVGAALAAFAAVLASDLATLWLVGLVAWAKERYDKRHPERHDADGWDAFATVAGALVALSLWQLWRYSS